MIQDGWIYIDSPRMKNDNDNLTGSSYKYLQVTSYYRKIIEYIFSTIHKKNWKTPMNTWLIISGAPWKKSWQETQCLRRRPLNFCGSGVMYHTRKLCTYCTGMVGHLRACRNSNTPDKIYVHTLKVHSALEWIYKNYFYPHDFGMTTCSYKCLGTGKAQSRITSDTHVPQSFHLSQTLWC